MNKGTIWTIVGVVAAVMIAWFLVNAVFSLLAFIIKLLVVAVVALIVFVLLRILFSRRGES